MAQIFRNVSILNFLEFFTIWRKLGKALKYEENFKMKSSKKLKNSKYESLEKAQNKSFRKRSKYKSLVKAQNKKA